MSKRPYLDKSYPAVDPNGDLAPLELDDNGNLKTTATISGDVVFDAVTIDNDAAHPVPVTSEQLGEVQASPTANTVLDRLKTLATLIGEVQASPTSNTLLDRIKSIATLLSGGLPAALTSGGGVKTGLVDALPPGTNAIGKLTVLPGLDIPAHDYVACSYTGSDLTGVVYKTGGSSGTTVATLTLAYTDGKLTSVTKS